MEYTKEIGQGVDLKRRQLVNWTLIYLDLTRKKIIFLPMHDCPDILFLLFFPSSFLSNLLKHQALDTARHRTITRMDSFLQKMQGPLFLVVPCLYAHAGHNLEPRKNSSLSLSVKISRNVRIGEGVMFIQTMGECLLVSITRVIFLKVILGCEHW